MASRDSGLGLRTGLSQTPPGAVVASAGMTGEGSHYKLAAFASRMWLLQDWWPEADIKSSPAGICSDTPSKTTGFIRGGCRRHILSVAFRHCCRSLLMRSEALGSTHTWGMGFPRAGRPGGGRHCHSGSERLWHQDTQRPGEEPRRDACLGAGGEA